MTITSENEKIVDKNGGTSSLSVSIHVMIWSTSWPTPKRDLSVLEGVDMLLFNMSFTWGFPEGEPERVLQVHNGITSSVYVRA